jgi:hypothetical protein
VEVQVEFVFLDPTAEPGVPVVPYELAVRLDAPGVTVGLLANSFPDSAAFLERLGRQLGADLPGLRFRSYDKGSAAHAGEPMEATAAAAIRNDCLAVVTAYGH